MEEFPEDNIIDGIKVASIAASLYPRRDVGAQVYLTTRLPEQGDQPLARLKFGAWSERSMKLLGELQRSLEEDVADAFTNRRKEEPISKGEEPMYEEGVYGLSTDFDDGP